MLCNYTTNLMEPVVMSPSVEIETTTTETPPTLAAAARKGCNIAALTGLNASERMKLALDGVLYKGETPTCAARKWHLERTTILYQLLSERKRLRCNNDDDGDNSFSTTPRKLFQSKFTSNQLLSAQQEENLANYLRQCYDMQSSATIHSKPPPLLCEEVARSFTHNFVHMHKLKYPSAWDAKQQAATDWFNGFVDRNPEVIECVAPSMRERKPRKRTITNGNMIKLEKMSAINGLDFEVDAVAKRPYAMHNEDQINTPQTQFRIKLEPGLEEDDLTPGIADSTISTTKNIYSTRDSQTDVEENDHITADDPMIPELIYQTTPSNSTVKNDPETPSESIAESVKRRTQRKPRILAEHLYAAELTMEPERVSYMKQRNQQGFTLRKSPNSTTPIKIQKVQTFYKTHSPHHVYHRNKLEQKQTSDETNGMNELPSNTSPSPPTPPPTGQTLRSLDGLKESIEKMHSDMNYLMQSMLMEMSENNRLLRRLVSSHENNH